MSGGSVVSGGVVVTCGDDVTGAVVVSGAGVSGELFSEVYSSEGDTEELSASEVDTGGFLTSRVPSGGSIGLHEAKNRIEPVASSAAIILFISSFCRKIIRSLCPAIVLFAVSALTAAVCGQAYYTSYVEGCQGSSSKNLTIETYYVFCVSRY
jgi:hypothetical protein